MIQNILSFDDCAHLQPSAWATALRDKWWELPEGVRGGEEGQGQV